MQPYRVILADDHAMFREGIKRLLDDMEGVHVIGEASDGLDLISLMQEVKPDLVVLDISMPRLGGLEAAKQIKRDFPQVKVLILSMHRDLEYFHDALASGAEGYLLKEDADTDLYTAISRIQRGERYVSPILSDDMARALLELRKGPPKTGSQRISAREKEILKLVAEGRTSAEIAQMLCISVRTVQNHRANIMRKLGVRNASDLLRYAFRKGYASFDK